MCGRFVLFTTGEKLIEAASAVIGKPTSALQGTPPARYNVAPTQMIPIISIQDEAYLEPARWGLLPHWLKNDAGPVLFNARAETVTEKPSFRDAFRKQRCVIPMDGYYEWNQGKPYFVSLGEELMWTAGIWDRGLGCISTAMITTESVEPLIWLHHRLPRFLEKDEVLEWLVGSPVEAKDMLRPSAPKWVKQLSVHEVQSAVGNVRNDYPELIG